MATIGTLNVKIAADTAALVRGMNAANQKLAQFGATARDAAVSAATAFAGARLLTMAKDALRLAAALDDSATFLRISTTRLQEWRFVAREAGVDQEKLDGALTRATTKLAEAATGTGNAAVIFRNLGISVRDSSGELKTLDEILPEISDKLKSLGAGDKLLVGKELFGEGSVQFIRFVEQASDKLRGLDAEIRKTAGVWNESVVKRGADLDIRLGVLSERIGKDFKAALIDLTPVLVKALQLVVGIQEAVDDVLTRARIGSFRLGKEPTPQERIAEIDRDIAAAERKLTENGRRGGTPFDRLRRLGPSERAALEQDLMKLRQERDAVEERIVAEGFGVIKPPKPPGPKDTGLGLTKPREGADRDIKFLEDLSRQVVEVQRLSVALGQGEAAMVAAERANAVMAATARLSAGATREQREQAARFAGTQFDLARNLRDAQRILEEIKTPHERYIEETARLNELWAANLIPNAEKYQQALSKIRERMLENNAIYQGAISLIDRMGEGIINFAFDGENAMQSFRAVAISALKDIAAEIFKLGALNPFKNALFGTKHPTFENMDWSWLTNLFGGSGTPSLDSIGAAFPGLTFGFATGGSFMVGGPGGTDKTPVGFMATRGERVTIETPDQQRRGDGSGVTIYQDFRGVNGSTEVRRAVAEAMAQAAPVIVGQAEMRVRDGAARNPRYFQRA